MPTRTRRWTTVCALLLASCTARLDGEGDAGPDAPQVEVPGVDRATPCTLTTIAGAPVRRLGHVEYGRTVRDLFPTLDLPELVFAADNAVHGFENYASQLNPSALLIEQYDAAARDIAQRALDAPEGVLPCDPAEDEEACGAELVEVLGARAFRRPLTDAELARYVAFFEGQRAAISFRGAAELTLHALLMSPQFLYRLELPQPPAPGEAQVALSGYEMATRLSYLIWQSMPDDELFRAAAAGELSTGERIEAQARRMLEDPKATAALVDFHRQWLSHDKVLLTNKDPELFPWWNETLQRSIREESDRFITHVFEDGSGTIAELLTSNTTYVNATLAAHYGVPGPASDDEWALVELPPSERSGLLTRANFSASFAHSTNGSPPLRAVALLERLLCAAPPAPPANLDTSISQDPEQPRTNRQLFESRTSEPGCQSCHRQMDGVGFGFEHYDSTGRYRAKDNGEPVDASGELYGTDADGPFSDAIELSAILASSDRISHCVSTNLYRYAHGRNERDADWCKIDELYSSFDESGGDLRELLLAIVRSHEFRHRPVVE